MTIKIDNRSIKLSNQSALYKATTALPEIESRKLKVGLANGIGFNAYNGVTMYVYRTKTQLVFRFYDDARRMEKAND